MVEARGVEPIQVKMQIRDKIGLFGFVRFNVCGRTGDRVILNHAEVLDAQGNFYTENLRAARQRVEYICHDGEETYEPLFTTQGFRYVRIDEYPGDLDPRSFTAVSVYSDMRPIGTFSCSHELINRLARNIAWGMRGNFVDIPTDCPQRDERLGIFLPLLCSLASNCIVLLIFYRFLLSVYRILSFFGTLVQTRYDICSSTLYVLDFLCHPFGDPPFDFTSAAARPLSVYQKEFSYP